MKTIIVLLCAVGISAAAQETPQNDPAGTPAFDMVIGDEPDENTTIVHGEIVRSILTNGLDNWRAVDDRRVIVYRTRSKPFLITLQRPARNLKFTDTIAHQSRTPSLHAGFDSLLIEGIPYQIERIERLTRETADRLLGERHAKDG